MKVTITGDEYQELMRVKREYEMLYPMLKRSIDENIKIRELILSEVHRLHGLAEKEIGKIFFRSKFKKYIYSSRALINLFDLIIHTEIAEREELLK